MIYDQDADDSRQDDLDDFLDRYGVELGLRPPPPSFLSHLRGWGLLIIALLLIVGLAFAAGVWQGHKAAACHSITEDSVITDCDYQAGEWRPI